MFRTVRTPVLAFDIVVACLAFLARGAIGYHDTFLVVVTFAMAIVVAVHRLSPALALAVAWAGVVLQLTLGYSPDVSNLAILLMLFSTAAYGSRVVRWLGFASTFVGAATASVYVILQGIVTAMPTSSFLQELPRYIVVFSGSLAASLTLFLLSWTVGLLYRTWLNFRASSAARQRAEAEQAHAERDVAIEQERNRIARDMHDVVAHSLAVVIAQADGARYAAESDPRATSEALATISSTAREALGDVRILLGQLRHRQGEAPQPVLADLDRLLDQLHSSGLAVTRTEHGEPREIGTGAQLAVYRIVQESLTNALRHGAEPTEATVRFEWFADRLEVEIANAIAGQSVPPETRSGHGIDGMRERAVLVGGSLVAEPSDSVFRVTATIPVAR
jgi:signal transduction histidine kinase